MTTCLGCRYADWKRTKSGRLHSSGDGRCSFEIVIPVLPLAFYWVGSPPKPTCGFIDRRRTYDNHCAYYQPAARPADHVADAGKMTNEQNNKPGDSK